MIKRLFILLFCGFGLCFSSSVQAQVFVFEISDSIDSVYASMSREERIGQLIMAAAYSDPNQNNEAELNMLIDRYKIGGLIFFKGTPHRQVLMTERLQQRSAHPLLIGMDLEWGLNMRLDSTIKFPRQMAIAASRNDSLIYAMGYEIGQQCKAMGVHVNFAPVVDINNNPENPVINDRSWSENRELVTALSEAYMRGLQDAGVMACLKHFPGHGDTRTDSHKELPQLNLSYDRIDSIELYPYRQLIPKGAMSVMAAHLHVEALDPQPGLPSSLSRRIIRNKLIDSMGFRGLIFTDALNMEGVKSLFKPGDLEVQALYAGNDILLFPEDVPAAIQTISTALDSCLLDSLEFEAAVKKVLAAKARMISDQPITNPKELRKVLHSPNAYLIREALSKQPFTALKFDAETYPLQPEKHPKIACVAIGTHSWNTFQRAMNRYGVYDFYGILRDDPEIRYKLLEEYLKQEDYDQVIFSIHNTNRLESRNYGISEHALGLMNAINANQDITIVSFGIPYNMSLYDEPENLFIAYQDIPLHAAQAASALHGYQDWTGELPVSASHWKFGDGKTQGFPDQPILQFGVPEELGLRTAQFDPLDSAIDFAIANQIMPGCQVLVAKNGRVIYNRSAGYQTYDNRIPVEEHTIYDLASVTKVAATTMAIMHLKDRGKIRLDRKASRYVKSLRGTNKSDITIRELLTHTAGLQSWIPFYLQTLDSQVFTQLYSVCKNDEWCLPLTDGVWAHRKLKDSIWNWILESPVKPKQGYLYSDLSFYILQQVVERFDPKGLDHYVDKHIYRPLALSNTGFHPAETFEHKRIAPTEQDKVFRRTLVQGHVHDPGAAMMGGVAGHAGLFSNAGNMAILMQLMLNKGVYKDVRIFESKTVEEFTRYQGLPDHRRGLGFDKPQPDPLVGTPCSRCASPESYGHSGFTGTYIWVDPKHELIYIFLSNRVYPSADNNKISRLNVRTNIQDMIYQIIGDGEKCRH